MILLELLKDLLADSDPCLLFMHVYCIYEVLKSNCSAFSVTVIISVKMTYVAN